MRVHGLLILLAFAALACREPFGYLPGGKLSGDPSSAPTDWDFAGESGFFVLETRPEEPYSVNLAYTIIAGHLYVNAGDTETRWVKNIAANPLVRIRIHDEIYALRAERVVDRAELVRFGAVWTSRGSFYRDPAQLDEAWVYRLETP